MFTKNTNLWFDGESITSYDVRCMNSIFAQIFEFKTNLPVSCKEAFRCHRNQFMKLKEIRPKYLRVSFPARIIKLNEFTETSQRNEKTLKSLLLFLEILFLLTRNRKKVFFVSKFPRQQSVECLKNPLPLLALASKQREIKKYKILIYGRNENGNEFEAKTHLSRMVIFSEKDFSPRVCPIFSSFSLHSHFSPRPALYLFTHDFPSDRI